MRNHIKLKDNYGIIYGIPYKTEWRFHSIDIKKKRNERIFYI